jgi:hypothetical protein
MTMSNRSKQRNSTICQIISVRGTKTKNLIAALVICLSSAGCASNPFMTSQLSADFKQAAAKDQSSQRIAKAGGQTSQRIAVKGKQTGPATPNQEEVKRDTASVMDNLCNGNLSQMAVNTALGAQLIGIPFLVGSAGACALVRLYVTKRDQEEALRQQEEYFSKMRANGR